MADVHFIHSLQWTFRIGELAQFILQEDIAETADLITRNELQRLCEAANRVKAAAT